MPTRFKTRCPSCGREGEIVADPDPIANCGDCLMDRVEVVRLEVEAIPATTIKFTVCVQRYVEETASVDIEADTIEGAIEAANQKLADGDVDGWEPGEDVINPEVYAVLDQNGDAVWG